MLGDSPNPKAYTVGQNANHIYIIGNHAEGCPGAGVATFAADYVTIDDNTINDCSWYSVFGPSGISMLDDDNSDSSRNGSSCVYKNYVINNTVFNNFEFLLWTSANPPHISDGEGIIIDTNLKSDYTGQDFGVSGYGNTEHLYSYTGYTLVENNVVYGNGSSGIEVIASQNVDVMYNSLFNNDLNYRACPGEITTPDCYQGEQG